MRIKKAIEWAGAATLPLVLAFTGTMVAATAVSSTIMAPAASASDVGGAISRDEVIQRAEFWLNKGLKYNQKGTAKDSSGKDYRTDCSGYVSMALHLTNDPGSATMLTDSRFFNISRAELKPGDFLVLNGHTFLFGGYHADGVHFTYYTFGSTPVSKEVGTFNGANLDGHPTSQYQAKRYKNIIDSSAPQHSRAALYSSDFNGNGSTDYAVWRESDLMYSILFDSGGEYVRDWGSPGEIPVAGDFNGNGNSDYVTFTPDTGMWHILFDDGGVYDRQWGNPGDIPVAGDFNGNGKSDYVTYRPSDNTWHILFDDGGFYERQWGSPGEVPVAGDFNGNGHADYVTYSPEDGVWHILFDSGGVYERQWGSPGEVPVSGDFNGNGNADYVTYRPEDGMWRILFDDGSGVYERPYGGPNYRPI
ncbi:hypothetical protein FKR81_21080 [Lentzea tibetensis]|uniref:NlpC/P60 domain-containing protein n=1 Tax=Lentzea tibetensis TaxID=2591470 RepID=A0A563ERP3_9PSEU|nr:hypothetical protein [Lentzea tibetensis]TWP50208.1 hypothetical protein FKR81_21080 [Lentzea tibetensis]